MSAPSPTKPTISWEILAFIRFFLAVAVMASHIKDPGPFMAWLKSFGGKPAVGGFLIISGYSIAASLSARSKGFIARRFLRIYPLYFGAVWLTVLVQMLVPETTAMPDGLLLADGPIKIIGNLLLTQMFLCKALAFNGPLWSLSIEFAYYLAAPFFARLPTRFLLLIFACSGLLFILPRDPGAGATYEMMTRFNAGRYLWFWLLGFLTFREGSSFIRWLGILAPPFLLRAYEGSVSISSLVSVLGGYAGILVAPRVTLPKRLRAIAQYAGDLSYPTYLLHFPIRIGLVSYWGITDPGVFFATVFAISASFILIFDKYAKRLIFAPLVHKLEGVIISTK